MRSTRFERNKPWVQFGKGVVTAVVMLAFAGGALTAFGNEFQFHPILASVPVDAAPTHAVAQYKPANQEAKSTPQEVVEYLNDWKYTGMFGGLGSHSQPFAGSNLNSSVNASPSGSGCVTISFSITITISQPGVSGGAPTTTTITETASITVCI